ncbi:Putative molybdenum carrier [Salinivirga cyanobacteriivorans]|uniref:Molybdenum carrier n=1 Tax=Salinivirga cyanobacteriivorans TaxID=1307839 RepID=A0A0S2HZR1_9BACT|nr:putative molybdenum carrier protein [Salinivirga cyanobacteriivorans]ALO15560.1 Putative molybdenum carrier [Salinivirga cyanobacteriivorans]
MKHLKKILSGGQTGVDQGALKAAVDANFPYGGWCPPDESDETGAKTQFKLQPTPESSGELAPDVPRSQRTEWNVRDADATLVLSSKDLIKDAGTQFTIQAANHFNKPLLPLAIEDPEKDRKLKEWLLKHNVEVLNIAGPPRSVAPRLEKLCYEWLVSFFSELQSAN